MNTLADMKFYSLICGALLAACGADQAQGTAQTLTYHRDIRPIVERECVGCHSNGNIAPFTLTSYGDVVEHQDGMYAAIRDRTMPPSPVDVSGACQTFTDRRYLSADEIARVAAWIDAGSPEGDPADAPLAIVPPLPPTYDFQTAPSAAYVSTAHMSDDYRCFVLGKIADVDRFVTAVNLVPGDPRVVHHVLLFANTTAGEDAAAVALDAADPQLGYSCFGNAGDGVGQRLITVWTPGSGPKVYEPGFGVRVPAGRSLVMQVHYNYSTVTAPDLTTVKLRTAANVTNEVYVGLLDDGALVVPPNQQAASYRWEIPLSDRLPGSAKIRWVAPHMHTYGRQARSELRHADGTTSCLADVPRWDFHWQRIYDYAQPVELLPSDTVVNTCTYDTRGRSTPLTWGVRTEDEMCLVVVGLTFD